MPCTASVVAACSRAAAALAASVAATLAALVAPDAAPPPARFSAAAISALHVDSASTTDTASGGTSISGWPPTSCASVSGVGKVGCLFCASSIFAPVGSSRSAATTLDTSRRISAATGQFGATPNPPVAIPTTLTAPVTAMWKNRLTELRRVCFAFRTAMYPFSYAAIEAGTSETSVLYVSSAQIICRNSFSSSPYDCSGTITRTV